MQTRKMQNQHQKKIAEKVLQTVLWSSCQQKCAKTANKELFYASFVVSLLICMGTSS